MVNTVKFTKHKQILNKVFLHIIFFFVGINISFSQQLYDHHLDKNKWGEIKEGIRYETEKNGGNSGWTFKDKKSYKKWIKSKKGGNANGYNNDKGGGTANGVKPKNIKSPKSTFKPNINFNSLKGLSYVGWIILILLAAGIIYLIVKHLIDSNLGNKKVKPVNYIEDDIAPSEIPLTELQRLLKEALDNENYRAAIRIYYLFILKDLSSRQWINWQKEKTNMHYLYEMQKQKVYNDFSQTVNYFEIVWYGKRDINQQQFKSIQPSFTNLLNQLGVE